MPGAFDLAFVLLFAVAWPLYTAFVEWPRYLARLRAGVPGVRVRAYVKTLCIQWSRALVALERWTRAARPLRGLGLSVPTGWRLALGMVLIVAIVWLMARQIAAVSRSPMTRAALRARLGRLDPVLPHSPTEFRLFLALSI